MLLSILALIGIAAFVSACGLILNHLFIYSPDKISAEPNTTILFSSVTFFISFLSFILFFGLLKYKKWFPGLYWLTILIYIFSIMLILDFSIAFLNHFIENSIFVIFSLLLPLVLGVYLLIKDEFFKNKNVSGV